MVSKSTLCRLVAIGSLLSSSLFLEASETKTFGRWKIENVDKVSEGSAWFEIEGHLTIFQAAGDLPAVTLVCGRARYAVSGESIECFSIESMTMGKTLTKPAGKEFKVILTKAGHVKAVGPSTSEVIIDGDSH